MIPIDFGAFDEPWLTAEGMTEAPMIHPSSAVRRSRMGAWTVLGPNTRLVDSDFGDYAYTARDCDIYNADVGKFCNIAAAVRINPTNHPMWRASQHHFTYRSRSHQLGAEDDKGVFDWRLAHRVTIGPDVWIGHGAILIGNRNRHRSGCRRRGGGDARRSRLYDRGRRSGAAGPPALRQGPGGPPAADCLVGLAEGHAGGSAAGFPRAQRARLCCEI